MEEVGIENAEVVESKKMVQEKSVCDPE